MSDDRPDDENAMAAEEAVSAEDAVDDVPEQLKVRRAKYDRLMNDPDRAPFPVAVARTSTLAEIRAAHPDLEAGHETGEVVGTTGRVIFVRNTGKLCFAMVREGAAELQVMLSLDRVGADTLAAWKSDVDLGDLVFVHGEVIASKRGELSVLADSFRITAKALRPLPVAHKPLSDEMRVRQRYVDLIVRPEAREMVHTRAAVLGSLRATFAARDFIEVQTPVLQLVHGGAAARPFHTHLNAFDLDMSLRIATELFLKRALVGGIERLYEIGPVFRNEGIDSRHSPEFTMIEAYEAYGDVASMRDLTRTMILDAAAAVGTTVGHTTGGDQIDLTREWRVIPLHAAVSEVLGEAITVDTSVEQLKRHADRAGVAIDPGWGEGQIALELFDKLVEHTLIEPTFVSDYPASVRPLARPGRDEPRLAEACDLIIGGVEVAHPVSELVDPVEQRRRLTDQARAAAAGDPEAMSLDEDFLQALEYGMPPSGGMGMGVERLLMLLTGKGIRDTILFPLLKPT